MLSQLPTLRRSDTRVCPGDGFCKEIVSSPFLHQVCSLKRRGLFWQWVEKYWPELICLQEQHQHETGCLRYCFHSGSTLFFRHCLFHVRWHCGLACVYCLHERERSLYDFGMQPCCYCAIMHEPCAYPDENASPMFCGI